MKQEQQDQGQGQYRVAQNQFSSQLLQARRLEGTGQLAGGIAHEFNNILTAIIALAEFAARDVAPGSAAREDIDEIRKEATKGARLVRHLLAFGRRQMARPELLHIGTIFQEVEPLLQRLVGERVLLSTDVAENLPLVEVDRAQLELVLLELVSNGADAMEAGGTLGVAVRPVVGSGDSAYQGRSGSFVEITVRDTGRGIDPAVRGKMLEPFFTTKGETHSGLGLSMVTSVAREYGGSFTIDSGELGTIARLLLPVSAKSPVTADYTLAARAEPGNETILVVEDEVSVRTVICRSLRGRGYNVLEAKNGEDALLVAERHSAPIHLVVTDVVMPEMGGTELFHHLRRWYPTMRILFISGYARGSIPPEAFEGGEGAGFLAKPFTLEQLSAEVHRIISRPRSQPSSE